MPLWRNTVAIMDNGPVLVPEADGTCILHLTSSIGVRRMDVKAPEIAPLINSPLNGNDSEEYIVDCNTPFATR